MTLSQIVILQMLWGRSFIIHESVVMCLLVRLKSQYDFEDARISDTTWRCYINGQTRARKVVYSNT